MNPPETSPPLLPFRYSSMEFGITNFDMHVETVIERERAFQEALPVRRNNPRAWGMNLVVHTSRRPSGEEKQP